MADSSRVSVLQVRAARTAGRLAAAAGGGFSRRPHPPNPVAYADSCRSAVRAAESQRCIWFVATAQG